MICEWVRKKMREWSEYPNLDLLSDLYDGYEMSERMKNDLDQLFRRIIDA